MAIRLPRDANKHKADYEWWYAHGYLTNEVHQQFGFMFSFFKFNKESVSRYFPRLKVYPAKIIYQLHMGFTDITRQTHYFDEQTFVPALGRVGMGKKGAQAFFGSNKLIQTDPQHFDLQMHHRDKKIHLHLFDQKGAVLHGKKGIIKIDDKGTTNYYSQPRLAIEGSLEALTIDADNKIDSTQFVHGKAWMDHQWGNLITHQPFLYWTWLAIQLDNNTELMVFEFFDKNGKVQGQSATWINQDGKYKTVKATINPLKNWLSPKSKIKHPISYRIKVSALKIDVTISAAMPDQ